MMAPEATNAITIADSLNKSLLAMCNRMCSLSGGMIERVMLGMTILKC